ncbi:vesicle transport through interaction with t-SNAREs homolog 1A isoform X3 [Pelecanus crispus]|uniref:vesicle transport through interaction with t-SNAREs homolog 1A isoform X3 n=1 Tax=Pelecanus crispus TaxID=36300 RepID=UPI003F5D1DC9
MSSDFESYEQDFAVLTAEITGRIGKVPKLVGDDKKQMVANVEKQLEEARELLEQMELEVREIPPQSRGMYSSRMRSYKQEMGKLEADFEVDMALLAKQWLPRERSFWTSSECSLSSQMWENSISAYICCWPISLCRQKGGIGTSIFPGNREWEISELDTLYGRGEMSVCGRNASEH